MNALSSPVPSTSPKLAAGLRAAGAVEQGVSGHTPLLLSASRRCLLVLEGAMDLFLVALDDEGNATGLRRHLFTLEAGDLALPFDGDSAIPPIGLLAVGTAGTRLLAADSPVLEHLARHGDRDLQAEIARALDSWIAGLSRAMARLVVPAPHIGARLRAAETIELAADTRLSAQEGVLWVACGDHDPLYLDSDHIARSAETLLPLHDSCWLVLPEARAIRGIDTLQALGEGHCWAGITALHAAVATILPLNLRLARVDELNRRRARNEANLASEQDALDRLAAPLTPPERRLVPETGEYPLAQACAAVAQALGHPFTYHGRAHDAEGVAPPGIDQLARANHLRVRRVLLEEDWWRADVGPFVLMTGDGTQPIAVVPGGTGGGDHLVIDPSIPGPPRRLAAKEAALLTGEAISFYAPFPDRALKGLDVGGGAFRWSRTDAVMVILLGFIGGILSLGVPIATGFLVDTVIPGHDSAKLMEMGLVLVAAATVTLGLRYAIQIAALRIEGRSGSRIQAAVMDRLLRLPMAFFKDYAAGDLAQRALIIQTIEQAISGTIIASLINGLFAMISLGLMFWYAPKLAFVALGLIALLAATTVVLGLLRVRRERAVLAATGAASAFLLQLSIGISRLRLAAAEDRAFLRWTQPYGDFLNQRFGADQITNVTALIGQAFTPLATACLFAVIYLADTAQSGIALGVVLAFLSAFGQALEGMVGLAGAAVQIAALKPAYAYAAPILMTPPEADAHKIDPGTLSGAIELSHLSFRYGPDGPTVLDDLSLTIAPGEFVALVGPSGGGKSTLLRLLLGFEAQDAGAILLDGHDLRSLDIQAVRRQFGVVLQNGRLMPGNLLDNILGANRHLSEEAAWEAARQVGLAEDIAAMPMGLRTLITDSSGALSGGQVQRLLLARAIANRPRILLLDEATSALDNRTQALVTASLNALSATRLVVAHRLSTVMEADRIVVLQDGRCREQGSYAELMAQDGLFRRLSERQLV
ncbi:ATP-binding cassette subfamily C protein [Ancylobacter aquaticus]|uniref:ATP-binding cassette subfamily C protein n=1 Tax=Ancylobacter aquaticus TaxID=100 RepID=A0A4R1HQF0_ANCAQ|nr:NHLP bacteriocin export ABC transporter permease/ATPase subunit [Ancylobacter aquaticus]TCK23481.1 ATP-binding cassette subfamily C protein [Ancylobacter aquaticus]